MLGIIMLSFVGTPGGFLGSGSSGIAEGGPLAQLWIQFQGIIVIFAWTAIVTWIILKLVGFVTDLRVSDESEDQGLDVTEHEERSYDFN